MASYLRRDRARARGLDPVGCGAGRIACLECRGTGKSLWPVEMTGLEEECIDCKGTGSQLVSI